MIVVYIAAALLLAAGFFAFGFFLSDLLNARLEVRANQAERADQNTKALAGAIQQQTQVMSNLVTRLGGVEQQMLTVYNVLGPVSRERNRAVPGADAFRQKGQPSKEDAPPALELRTGSDLSGDNLLE